MEVFLGVFILQTILFQNKILPARGDTKICTEWAAPGNILSNSKVRHPSYDDVSDEIDDDDDNYASKNRTCVGGPKMTRRVKMVIMTRKMGIEKKKPSKNKEEVLVRAGKCHEKATLIDVKFGKKVLYSVCHNEDIDHTYYVKSYIEGSDKKAETGGRPKFQEDDFFPSIHADKSYSRKGQTKTLEHLLGTKKLATKYIKAKGNDYFARGHLFPNADPAAKVKRDATFYYINTFPQWQPNNGGNWNALEGAARKLAKSAKANLTIWSGTFGNMKLPNSKNKMVELWFGRDDNDEFVEPKRLPVPHLAWKIIHYEECDQAVVIVQINNPWDDSTKPFCESLCDQISWIKWDLTNRNKGYTFCCDATKFQSYVSFAPKIDKKVKLLKDSPKGKGC